MSKCQRQSGTYVNARGEMLEREPLSAMAFRCLSYVGVAAAVVLSYWDVRLGGTCLLFAFACSYLARIDRLDEGTAYLHVTLFEVRRRLRMLGDSRRSGG